MEGECGRGDGGRAGGFASAGLVAAKEPGLLTVTMQ